MSSAVGLVFLLMGGGVHVVACKYFVLTLAPSVVGWAFGNATAARVRSEYFGRLVDLLLLTGGALAIVKAVVG